MRADFEVHAEWGLIGAWDESAPPAVADPRDDQLRRRLRDTAKDGRFFFIDTEDPVTYRVHVAVDEEPDPTAAAWCESAGGAFRLDLPSGTMVLGDVGRVDSGHHVRCAPGSYVLMAYARREFDPSQHREALERLVGAEEWRYHLRVDNLGAAGCLALGLAALLILIPWTRPLWPFVMLLLIPTLSFAVLSRMPRYKRVEDEKARFEKGLPHFLLHLRSTATPELAGGWIPGL